MIVGIGAPPAAEGARPAHGAHATAAPHWPRFHKIKHHRRSTLWPPAARDCVIVISPRVHVRTDSMARRGREAVGRLNVSGAPCATVWASTSKSCASSTRYRFHTPAQYLCGNQRRHDSCVQGAYVVAQLTTQWQKHETNSVQVAITLHFIWCYFRPIGDHHSSDATSYDDLTAA